MSEEKKVTGKIKAIYPVQTFDSGAQKVVFIVANNTGYNYETQQNDKEKCFAFEMFAGAAKTEKIEKFNKYNKVGNVVDVKFEFESRENPKKEGQWFTSLSAFSVFKADAEPTAAEAETSEALEEDVSPF